MTEAMNTGTGVSLPDGHGGVYFRNPSFPDGPKVPSITGVPTLSHLLPHCAKLYGNLKFHGTRTVLERFTNQDDKTGATTTQLSLGEYEWTTFEQTNERIKKIGHGLRGFAGFSPGQILTIYMNTCPDWSVCAHATWGMAATVATVYATLGEEAIIHSVNQTQTTHIVTEFALLQQLRRVCEKAPNLTTVIVCVPPYDDDGTYTSEKIREHASALGFPPTVSIFTIVELEHYGNEHNEQNPPPSPKPDDVAVVMYTSGSTGVPKGVELTHTNVLASMVGIGDSLPPFVPGDDVFLAFLPLAHILALAAELFATSCGVMVGFGSPLTLTDTSPRIKPGGVGDLRVLKPTILALVPTVLTKVKQGITGKINSASALAQKVFWGGFYAKEVALQWEGYTAAGVLRAGLDRILFDKIKDVLGGRVKFIFSGGAPLSEDTHRFIEVVLGVPVMQGYGATETGGLGTISRKEMGVFGTVGGPYTTVEVKLVDWEEGGYRVSDKESIGGCARGEICVSGPSVARGYFGLPEKTAEDFVCGQDGKLWFHTGDIGLITKEGRLKIIDRKKDIVKLQMGEYVSLGKVEGAVHSCPLVEQCCLHVSPDESFGAVLVVAQKAALLPECESRGLDTSRPYEEICADPQVCAFVLESIQEACKTSRLHRHEVPARCIVVTGPWTPEGGLVTASLKLQRTNIYRHYARELADAYAK